MLLLNPGQMISPAAATSQAPQPGGGGYTGPLDLVAGAVVAYGQRALSAAKLGTALYTIREDAGNTTQSFNSDAVTGDAPVAAINSFLNGANGHIALWNDQSGGETDVIASGVNQPSWVTGTIPAISSSGANQYLEGAVVSLPSFSAITLFCVLSSGEGNRAISPIDFYSSGSGFLTLMCSPSITYSAGTVDFDTGSDDETHEAGNFVGEWLSNASPVIVEVVSSGGTPDIFVNGVLLTAGPYGDGVFGPTGTITYIDIAQFGSGTDGSTVREEIIYNSALSAADRLAIRQNIATYYGITLPFLFLGSDQLTLGADTLSLG